MVLFTLCQYDNLNIPIFKLNFEPHFLYVYQIILILIFVEMTLLPDEDLWRHIRSNMVDDLKNY